MTFLPSIKISSDKFNDICEFMIDSGSSVNLIKFNSLNNPAIDTEDNLILRGLAHTPVKTLGSITMEVLKRIVKFYVVPDNVIFQYHGILGTEFLKNCNATLDYRHRALLLDDLIIPFTTKEQKIIPPRTVTPISFIITNPEIDKGYIPMHEPTKGVYFGEAIVSNSAGRCYLYAYNTTEQTQLINISSMPLQEYDDKTSELQSDTKKDELDIKFNNTANVYPIDSFSDNERFQHIKSLLRLNHLNSEEMSHVEGLIRDNLDRFFLPGDKLECTNITQHTIPTTDNSPVHVKQYRYPPVHRDEIDRQIKELLTKDIIQPSKSPFNSPLWIVPKKCDSLGQKRWRMVIDYRQLNEKTIGDSYPLPNIAEILDQLGNAKYFSIFDLAQGFHQIPMNPTDSYKTAFSTPYGHYEYKRMPFGLKNAPATFQRLMDGILTGLQGTELFVYLDDIVIYAKSLTEHGIKIKKLMQKLREANLQLQI